MNYPKSYIKLVNWLYSKGDNVSLFHKELRYKMAKRLQHTDYYCSKYNNEALPDENNNCSQCGHKL